MNLSTLHGTRVPEIIYLFIFFFSVHYNSIVQKSSFKLKFDFFKIEFQNRDISLISLKNEAKYGKVCVKWTFANFLP